MSDDTFSRIKHALDERFGATVALAPGQPGAEMLARLLEHRSHRKFADRAVAADLLRLICACALSAPSKSDLQQADIIEVRDTGKRKTIADLIPDMPWVRAAPVFLVFCANSRRIRQVGELRGKPFANDHLDAFMNAAVDAGIVLEAFIIAAAAAGLGCCPISAVRNHAKTVSDLLEVTVHVDCFDESGLAAKIDGYDRRRAAKQQYAKQRSPERYGTAAFYGWSEDKARQYSHPERADFGAFIRGKRFKLD